MTVDQSPLADVQSLMSRRIFAAKEVSRIGTWNVRTLFQAGKTAQLLREFDAYRMDILGISEMRWTGSGRFVSDGKLVIYSGNDSSHIRGVGIIFSRRASAALIGWKPISDRIVSARLQGRHGRITIIQAYAPIDDTEDTAKDSFYDHLQEEIDATPRHDIILLLGDFNAQIDRDRQGIEHVIGPFGSALRKTDNGDRLISLCATNNMHISNTFYRHKNIHKKTWRHPDGQSSNEIDYICVSKRWRSSVIDVRVQRGADVGSDHHLLIAKFRLRLKRLPTPPRRNRPFAVMKLKEPMMTKQFQLEIQNRFQALAEPDEDDEVEDRWTNLKCALTASAETVIGRRRGSQKEQWIQDKSWRLIDERKRMKRRRDQTTTEETRLVADELYRNIDRQIKRSCRQDKREWIEKKGAEAQEAADRNDPKTLYRIVRDLSGSYNGHGAPVKDKAGKPLLKKEEQEKRWIEHFSETLNQPDPTETYDASALTPPAADLQVNLGPISDDETKIAIGLLKTGKAAGLDEITPEMLKSGGNIIVHALTSLMNACWCKSAVPDEWRQGMIIRLPKKGDLTNCDNWRGITLLSVPGKVFCIVLLRRLQQSIDNQLREQQAGFRRGRSCNEQIFVLRSIIEQSIEFQ